MNDIFEKLNYTVSNSEKELKLVYVNNPDGTPRWICPANAKEALFLKFYAVTNFKSKAFAFVFKMIFKCRLQTILLKKSSVFLEPNSNSVGSLNVFSDEWALFTGTIGPNNKMLLYKKGKENRFFKIATTPKSVQIIANERNIVTEIQKLHPTNYHIPTIFSYNQNFLELEDISTDQTRSNQLKQAHFNFFDEIYEKTLIKSDAKTVFSNNRVSETIEELKIVNDHRIPLGLIEKLEKLHKSLENQEVELAFSHGDFTSWNMYEKGGVLNIYDWELADEKLPIGFDAFHFIFQNSILIERKNWVEIKKEIYLKLSLAYFSKWTNGSENTRSTFLKWYLLLNTTHYLKIYSQQKEWHIQIHWLLHVWNEAMSDCLKLEENHRELLISDFFDFLTDYTYGAIKFPNIPPSKLSEYSDIDLCIQKKDEANIIGFLSNHIFVNKVFTVRKSFMNSLHLTLSNGQVLSIDLIWQFKRKESTFLDATKILRQVTKNDFGVSILSTNDLLEYVFLFYVLNNAKIPEKYKYLLESYTKESFLFEWIEEYKNQSKIDINKLRNLVANQKENKGGSGLKNKLFYVYDVILEMMKNKGLIITFSGVDGAGKSTIIETIKQEVEKKLRKKTVVIRHRPSLLPILSAWTKGKEQAEKEAASTLPRQGKNKSTLSSLFRFLYYYLDYIFGQFYVYFKYKFRGYVVLYDRYYFDFILDGRRSNIALPESLIKKGYKFILKPDCNFFLYADPEIILKRKQELTAETITELTQKYSQLFKELEVISNDKISRYFLINNIELEKTKETIMQALIKRLHS